jgi:hypothetical protein
MMLVAGNIICNRVSFEKPSSDVKNFICSHFNPTLPVFAKSTTGSYMKPSWKVTLDEVLTEQAFQKKNCIIYKKYIHS